MMPRALYAPALSLLATAALAAPASYTADPAASKLEFSGMQAGAPFTGAFKTFSATVDFAADALDASKFDVQIDLASEDSKDKDRDQTIQGPDIFDVAKNPTAHYVTKSIVKSGAAYSAQGSLTLHGVTREVPLAFTLSTGATPKLEGTATLKRLDFGVGQGDWKSTEWVANEVKVSFSLSLKPKT